MSPTTASWRDRSWAKRWMLRRSELDRRQETGQWINCDANCYCCRYMVEEGCITTDDDANPNCPAPGPTPATGPAPSAAPTTTVPSAPEIVPTTTSSGQTSPVPTSTQASTSTPAGSAIPTSTQPSTSTASGSATQTTASSTSVRQEWVFPVATGSVRARQANTIDTASFGPVYREDSMVVQWTPEDATPGIQWLCESNAGNLSGGLVSSNQSQPLQIQFDGLAEQANSTDDVYCRLGFTDSPGQTVQWQYINAPNADGAKVISAPANVATAAVATVTSLSSPTSSSESGSGGGGLSTGAAAGVGVGVGIAVLTAIILGMCCWRRRKNKSAHLVPVWAHSGKKSTSSGSSGHPSAYWDSQKRADGVYELPGSPLNPTELPAGIKGTAAMPSELYDSDEKRIVSELGSDKDFEEQQIRPRPLVPHPAQRGPDEEEIVIYSPSSYGEESESGTYQSAVSPASGTLSSGEHGSVSPMTTRIQSQNSPDGVSSQDTSLGWTADRNSIQRKAVREN